MKAYTRGHGYDAHSVVSCRNGEENTSPCSIGRNLVKGSCPRATKTEIHHSPAKDVVLSGVSDAPVDSGNDATRASTPLGIEDFDGDNVSPLGHTKGRSGECSGGMGSMSILIPVNIVDLVGTPNRTASKIRMVDIDTSIDPIDSDALTSGLVEDIVIVTPSNVGDSSKAVRRSVPLCHESCDIYHSIRFNIGDLCGVRKNMSIGR